MRARLAAMAAFAIPLAWCACAEAQSGYFQGLTPRPADAFNFPASLTVTRSASAGGGGYVVPAMYTRVEFFSPNFPAGKLYPSCRFLRRK